ncbi:MAG: 4Fe-4S dicluster domain-containing protein [candidate division Zixibacteria bacterium]|nr:4Fe-4S dicluster domain-containing protein [candidate division Zixibacteria bacterium]
MPKVKRQMIVIDEDKCNGCGLCIPGCPEGALQIINDKAVLVKESYCDGLGACLGECPEDALSIEEKLVDDYDEQTVIETLRKKSPELVDKHVEHMRKHNMKTVAPSGCPSAQMMAWNETNQTQGTAVRQESQLRQWPIQLHLVPPAAPYFKNADIAVMATCAPFSYANFHQDYIKDKAIAVACPKLDNTEPYLDKLTQIIATAKPRSIEVIVLEVPCCTGLVYLVMQAIKDSGQDVPLIATRLSVKGEFLDKQEIDAQAV